MDAIFSFKLLTTDEKFLTSELVVLARLAVISAQKYHSTFLYTDEKGAELFKRAGITFDKVVILPEIEKMTGTLICMPKIYAMMFHKNPYVHLDFDVWTNTKYQTSELVGFGHPEVNLNTFSKLNDIRYLTNTYLDTYEKEMYRYFDPSFSKNWNWSLIPNHSVIIVNNPDLVKDIYNTIIGKLKKLKIDSIKATNFASFIEQFLFARYLDWYGVKYSFMYDVDPVTLINSGSIHVNGKPIKVEHSVGANKILRGVKYAHLQGYRELPYLVRALATNLLKNYKQII